VVTTTCINQNVPLSKIYLIMSKTTTPWINQKCFKQKSKIKKYKKYSHALTEKNEDSEIVCACGQEVQKEEFIMQDD